MIKPFFSIVIPLYNKEKYIKQTIDSVLNQDFQDFEILVINDGSMDKSVEIVNSIKDKRIKVISQENSGVSVARNRGIKESEASYIVFLDADDFWLPEFLQTLFELIKKFPKAGLYATSYKKRKLNNSEVDVNIRGLPSKDFVGIIPNYFRSIVEGDLLIWTSATCIPKRVFIKNNIWFPPREKYGEDQYVWARVAMQYKIAYNTKAYSIYQIEADNNTTEVILKEKNPHKSILMLQKYQSTIKDIKELKYFNIYIEKHIKSFILKKNIQNNYKLYAFKQLFLYQISISARVKLFILLLIPSSMYIYLKKIKNAIFKSR